MYDCMITMLTQNTSPFLFSGVQRVVARHVSTETKDDGDDGDGDDGNDDFLFSNFLVHAFDPRVLRAGGGGMVTVVVEMVWLWLCWWCRWHWC